MAEKMYIPTFIADANFKPTVVQPRAFFYNGKKEISTPYRFTYQSGPSSFFVARETEFPYFDHYSSSSIGQDPNLDSESLLFFNEGTVYGFTPQENLYTQYWSKYVGLLYNPATRFLECSGVIPFGRYVNMKLNDIVIYKGNHFHLRAINNYNLNTGECNLQLLGPILDDTFDQIASTKPTPIQPNRPTTTSTTTSSTTTSSTTTSSTTTSAPCETGLTSIAVGYSAASSTTACEKTDVRQVYKTDLWLNPGTVVYSTADGCNITPGFYAPLPGEEGAGSVFEVGVSGDVISSELCPTGTTSTSSTTTSTTTTSTTTTSTTTTTSPFVGYLVTFDQNNEATACASLSEFTVYSQCNPITLPGEGLCYLYNTPNINDPVSFGYYSDVSTGNYYYVENNGLVEEILPCPNTTTTTQPPCFPVGVVRGSDGEEACCDGVVDTHYFNASTVEGATVSYGTDPTCTTPNPLNTHYKVGVQYYVSTGGVMSGPFDCPDCP